MCLKRETYVMISIFLSCILCIIQIVLLINENIEFLYFRYFMFLPSSCFIILMLSFACDSHENLNNPNLPPTRKISNILKIVSFVLLISSVICIINLISYLYYINSIILIVISFIPIILFLSMLIYIPYEKRRSSNRPAINEVITQSDIEQIKILETISKRVKEEQQREEEIKEWRRQQFQLTCDDIR